MAIVAPLSKYKKNNHLIIIGICVLFAAWCVYDGYFNKEWIEKHKDAEGNAETYLVFNRNAPLYLIPLAVLVGVRLFLIRNKKIVAEENELVIDGGQRIGYDAIEKIDKTKFKSKGKFVITYKNEQGKESDCKINDRMYDNLEAVLDHLVAKIS